MEILRNPPSRSEYVPLSEHQSQTPASFYDGPAILYHHASSCIFKITKHDLEATTALAGLASGAKGAGIGQVNGHTEEVQQNGENQDEDDVEGIRQAEVEIPNIDVWVTSERFILFSPSQTSGVSIPYPSISLHAISRASVPTLPAATATSSSLFLQILPQASATYDDHDPDETISLYLAPPATASTTPPTTATAVTESNPPSGGTATNDNEVTSLFTALSACANRHPDPPMHGDDDEDDEDFAGASFDVVNGADGLPPPMPGSGGWITAENVGEVFDEDGNWRGGTSLGEGAGRVRGRGEGEEEEGNEDGDEEGGGEETKWSRTG